VGGLPLQDRPVTLSDLIAAVSAADLEQPALRGLRLFALAPEFFAALSRECLVLARAERPSEVGDRAHVTHWTKPRGTVLQYSLLNRSGRFDDTSTDHDLSCFGKRFHSVNLYPSLAALVAAFPHSINFRLNVLTPGASLSPHREPVCFRARGGAVGVRLRLHLPVVTNPAAEILLDDQIFVFPLGEVALFNQGCVHAAANGGATDRLHLVWDMLLTRSTCDSLFGDGPAPIPARRYPADQQALSPRTASPPRPFIGLEALVEPAEVVHAQVIEPQ
jgi:hypothetical protein